MIKFPGTICRISSESIHVASTFGRSLWLNVWPVRCATACVKTRSTVTKSNAFEMHQITTVTLSIGRGFESCIMAAAFSGKSCGLVAYKSHLYEQARKVIWRRPHRIRRRNRDPFLYLLWIPQSFRPKHDLDPFSRVCTAKPHDRQTC